MQQQQFPLPASMPPASVAAVGKLEMIIPHLEAQCGISDIKRFYGVAQFGSDAYNNLLTKQPLLSLTKQMFKELQHHLHNIYRLILIEGCQKGKKYTCTLRMVSKALESKTLN